MLTCHVKADANVITIFKKWVLCASITLSARPVLAWLSRQPVGEAPTLCEIRLPTSAKVFRERDLAAVERGEVGRLK